VLGLLVSTAKRSYDTRRGQVNHLATDLILLDRSLELYGLERKSVRRVLILEELLLGISPDAIASLRLSRRESEVLAAAANGSVKSEVAERLGVSQSTLESHVLHINEKPEVPNTTAAVARAFDASRVGEIGMPHGPCSEAPFRFRTSR
jgi:DNA-binding CsgD family transcriptional regulator